MTICPSISSQTSPSGREATKSRKNASETRSGRTGRRAVMRLSRYRRRIARRHHRPKPAVPSLRPAERVQVADHALQALVEDVGVDLRRRDVGVAEELLHDAQVGAVLEEVAREGVPEHVRADLVGAQARRPGDRLEVAGEGLPGQVPGLAVGREEPGAGALAGALAGLLEGARIG